MSAPTATGAHPDGTHAATTAFDHDKLAAARFRAVYELPYLAAAMFSLRTVPTTDLPFRSMAVDTRLRLYVDPGFVDEHPVDQLAGVLVHEVFHVLFDHAGRAEALGVAGELRHRCWGLAADAAINQVIATTPTRTGPPLPLPQAVLPAHLGFGDDPDLPAEVIYTTLLARVENGDATPTDTGAGAGEDLGDGPADTDGTADTDDDDDDDDDDGDADDDDGDDGGAGGGGHDHDDELQDGAGGPGPIPEHDCGSGEHGAPRPWEAEASDNGIDGIGPAELTGILHRVALAARAHADATAQGTLPDTLQRWFSGLLEPQVDWRRRLAASVRAGIATTLGQVLPTYARPSRRTSATGGVLLPARRAPVVRVAVVIDTSGSMHADDLAQAVSELAGILRAASVRDRNIRVWSCDTEAHEITLTDDLTRLTLTGGGGTDLTAGLIAATARRRDRPDLVVVLTDGGTDWPDQPPPASVVVGLIGSHAVDTAPHWADVVRIEPEGR